MKTCQACTKLGGFSVFNLNNLKSLIQSWIFDSTYYNKYNIRYQVETFFRRRLQYSTNEERARYHRATHIHVPMSAYKIIVFLSETYTSACTRADFSYTLYHLQISQPARGIWRWNEQTNACWFSVLSGTIKFFESLVFEDLSLKILVLIIGNRLFGNILAPTLYSAGFATRI